jgi:hypothetical protein
MGRLMILAEVGECTGEGTKQGKATTGVEEGVGSESAGSGRHFKGLWVVNAAAE